MMSNEFRIIGWGFLIAILLGASGFGAARKTLLREGFVLRGVDGKLTRQDNNDKWFFELNSDVSDDRGLVKAGTSLELLPSATLERMTADGQKHSDASPVKSKSPEATAVPTMQTSNGVSCRLWARVTEYRGKNFLFPTYFLPFSNPEEATPQRPETLQKPQQQQSRPTVPPPAVDNQLEPTINEPNDVLTIPQEIVEKLKAKRIALPRKLPETTKETKIAGEDSNGGKNSKTKSEAVEKPRTKQDSILANRTAILIAKQSDGRPVFVLDALGRNVQKTSLRLLPCQALELAEQRQSAEPDPLRFKIAGIVTEYKGHEYLLLQQATQVYSYGNFGR